MWRDEDVEPGSPGSPSSPGGWLADTESAPPQPTLMNKQDTTALCLAGVPHREWSRNIPITTVGAPLMQ